MAQDSISGDTATVSWNSLMDVNRELPSKFISETMMWKEEQRDSRTQVADASMMLSQRKEGSLYFSKEVFGTVGRMLSRD